MSRSPKSNTSLAFRLPISSREIHGQPTESVDTSTTRWFPGLPLVLAVLGFVLMLAAEFERVRAADLRRSAVADGAVSGTIDASFEAVETRSVSASDGSRSGWQKSASSASRSGRRR